ncbi:uncharacterized protein LOC133849849 [Drosophila sulfurigaster albostrigata]|uniref:uncharacterized protein LOC133849849 n=1 Tax=Drosophila sulfurigaster albostrigata TaxID=89887 RepID=UPI002D21A73A|nr:uncharacterized protein LOC133849849 [Drosophila sulfurigaster albostrigata]
MVTLDIKNAFNSARWDCILGSGSVPSAELSSGNRLEAAFRKSAIRIISGFRTISEDAAFVIAGVPPFVEMARERADTYRQLRSRYHSNAETRTVRTAGRQECLERKHGQVNFHLTQVLSGHGCFRSYLHRFGHEASGNCSECGTLEDAHTMFACKIYGSLRNDLKGHLAYRLRWVVPLMLQSVGNWVVICEFVSTVMQTQRSMERARRESME